MPKQTVYLSVGANIEPEVNISRGLRLLSAAMPLKGISTFYRTAAIGRPAQPDYLNGVVSLETELPPLRMRDFLREIEHALGRVRSKDIYAARTLDLDILLYGDAVFASGDLSIPDPDILERPFLAAGILELDPAIRLPGAGKNLSECIDAAGVEALVAAPEFTRALKEQLP